MKTLIALVALTLSLNAHSELLTSYIDRVAAQTCEGSATSLTIAELQDKIAQVHTTETGCRVLT